MATHLAVDSPLSEGRAARPGRAEGWRTIACDRSGAFNVVELWLEERVLVEALDPVNAARVAGFMQHEVLAKLFGTQESQAAHPATGPR